MKLEINVRAVLGVLLLLLASCVPLMSQYLYHHSGEWLHSADRESFGVKYRRVLRDGKRRRT